MAFLLAAGLAMPLTAATTAFAPEQAQAGPLKKAKKGTKLIGKGAGWAEKKLARKGKAGKFLSKGFKGVRKGSEKLGKGIGKVQKGTKKAFNKVCKGKCAKAAKAGKKVVKNINRLKDQAEKQCERFGKNSKACRAARNALEFASPI